MSTIDVHAHCFPSEDCFSPDFVRQAARARGAVVDLVTDYRRYWESAPEDTRVIVFGGKARRSGIWVDDSEVRTLADAFPDHMVGFL